MSSGDGPSNDGAEAGNAATNDALLREIEGAQLWIRAALEHPVVPLATEPLFRASSRGQRLQKLESVPPSVRLWTTVLMDMYDKFEPASNFREPVNVFQFDPPLLSYHQTVREPSSLRTVIDTACNGGYSNTQQMQADIDRIWKNAQLFNGPTNPVTKQALQCQEQFKVKLQEAEDNQPATDEEIRHLCDMLESHPGDEIIVQMQEYLEAVAPHMIIDNEVEFQGMNKGLYRTLLHLVTKRRLPTPVPNSRASVSGRAPSGSVVGTKRRRE